MLVPTPVCPNVPDGVKVTTSEPTIPTKVPPVTVAVLIPSYSLLAVVAPLTVNALAVISLAVKLGCVKL